MKPIRPSLLLGFATLLVVALGALGLLERWNNDVENAQPNQSVFELLWRAGTLQQYKVLVDSSFRMDMTGTRAIQSLRLRLEGTLEALTLEVGPDQALVGMRLSAADLQIGGQSDPQTNLALTSPFRVRFSSGGMPVKFEFPAGVSAENREILENLLRMFQAVIRSGKTWVTQETNTSGTYEAVYQRLTATQVEKSKRRFVDPAMGSAEAEITSSESIRIDAKRDWIAAMAVDEIIRTEGPEIETTNHATLELQALVTGATAPDEWNFAAAPAPDRVDQGKAAKAALSAEEAQKQLHADLLALDAAHEGRSTLVHRLRNLLSVHDTLPAVLLELLRTEQLSDPTHAQVFLALELSGTVPAQAALRSVLADESWPSGDALRAIIALGGVANPAGESIEALWDTARNQDPSGEGRQLAGTATLALGSLGNRMNATEASNYSTLRMDLLNGALSNTDPRLRANYIVAIGNTGDESLAREIVAFLDEKEPRIRSAAAQSLGRLGSDAVADDLIRHFEQESNSVVRGAIAEALASSTTLSEPVTASIRETIRVEPDENSRFHLARVLAQNLEASPKNKVVLQDLLRSEQSKRIRQYVGEMLVSAN